MSNIEELRTHLFDTLKALKDKEQPMEIARAKAVADVARVIVDSAKVEVDFARATRSRTGTSFIPASSQAELIPPRQLNGRADGDVDADDADRFVTISWNDSQNLKHLVVTRLQKTGPHTTKEIFDRLNGKVTGLTFMRLESVLAGMVTAKEIAAVAGLSPTHYRAAL